MKRKTQMATKRLAVNAVLIAIYVTLRYFSIPFGNYFRFTLAPFAVILCALLYGPVDGLLVGFLGEFLSQVLGPYGLTHTTLLWCVGESARGLTLGLFAMLFVKKWLFSAQSPNWMQMSILVSGCVLTGVLAALCQTYALYVDSRMFGYYTYAMVFGVLIWRILVYAGLSVIFGYLCVSITSALRKAKLV